MFTIKQQFSYSSSLTRQHKCLIKEYFVNVLFCCFFAFNFVIERQKQKKKTKVKKTTEKLSAY